MNIQDTWLKIKNLADDLVADWGMIAIVILLAPTALSSGIRQESPPRGIDVIVTDPPRAGMHPDALRALIAHNPNLRKIFRAM